MPTLSVAVTVKVTVWDWDPVVNVTELSFTVKALIDGAWLSDLVIVADIDEVLVLPAASPAVNVNVSVVDPKE
jgi:hypothetical protein